MLALSSSHEDKIVIGSNPSKKMPAPYVPYLEGMRGIAALYVVVYHVRSLIDPNYAVFGPAAALIPGYGLPLRFGHVAVGVFIVISGYVLTIPFARKGVLSGGFFGFMKRRLRRLLPAYYAALVLAVPFWFFGLRATGVHTNIVHFAADFLAHVFLIHDLFLLTIFQINGPLWSIAVEVQIYLCFALLLIAVQRRFGIVGMIVTAFVIGLLPTAYGALVRHIGTYPFQYAHFWYLGLFALGSAAAWIVYGPEKYSRLLRVVPWKVLSITSAAATALVLAPQWATPEIAPAPLPDVFLGITFAAGFLAIANDQAAGRRSIVAKLFAAPPLVRVGTFSYSLYLIHYPICWSVLAYAQRFKPAERLAVGSLLLIGLLPLAYAFARVFEFPFISHFRRNNEGIAMQAHLQTETRASAV